ALGGTVVDDSVRWGFNHLEPYLRRTYKGTTPEMIQTVRDGLSGKRRPPAPNDKEKPGVGPEVKAEAKTEALRSRPPHPPTGVGEGEPDLQLPQMGLVAAPPVAALLALLAMMFPTVFGGWRRWLGLLTVLATNSTLYGLHYWFATSLEGR